ncbi:MAG TPA: flippase [Candidatus Dormibacteraeota bacterium]|nr:flippase [Candidatus Dormibacteraeota bacterium]
MTTLPNNVSTAPAAAGGEVLRLEFRRNMGQISRHSLMFFAGTIFTMGAGYLVKIYVARVLGAELLGIYALGMTLVSFTQLVGCLGLNGAAARYVAVYNATGRFEDLRSFLTRSVGVVFSLNLILSVGLVFGGGWLARRLYHAPDLAQYIPLFAALTILGALNVFYCQVLAGFKDISKRTVITNFIGTSLVSALTVPLLAMGTGMRGYLWAQIVNSIVIVVLLVAVAWRLTPKTAHFSWAPLPPIDPEIKAFAAASFGMGALDFLVSQADKILLGLYLNPTLVGIYVVASTLSALIPLILQSVNQIFAPVIADLHAQARKDVLERLFQTLTKWVLGLTLPLAFVVIAFAVPLMRIFGRGFEAGWPVLVIGVVGQVVNCGVGSVGYLLLMSGNQRRLIRVQFVMVGVSLLMNIALIPMFGVVGAALASATVNVAGNFWNLMQVRKALQISPYNRSYFALTIPAAFAAATVVLLRVWTGSMARPWLGILAALAVSYVAFCGGALKFSLDEDDRMIATSAWGQLRGSLQRR